MEEDYEVFLYAGYLSSPKEFIGAIGVWDYFWTLEPGMQKKMIRSWVRNLTELENMIEELDIEEIVEEGNMLILADNTPLEVRKFTNNVVPFKK